jgi:hypothetical protein
VADTNVIPGNLVVQGVLTPKALSAPANCVGDANVNGSNPITAVKLEHQHQKNFAQVTGSVAAAERRAVHSARSAGTVVNVRAKLLVANSGGGTPTVTVDVLKNGTSILSAAVSIVTADGTNWKTGAITVPTYAADDVFEVNVTVAAGGGTLGQGLTVELTAREAA